MVNTVFADHGHDFNPLADHGHDFNPLADHGHDFNPLADHGHDFNPLADHMTTNYEISLHLMLEQLIVCPMISQKLHIQKLHKRASVLQRLLGRFCFSQN